MHTKLLSIVECVSLNEIGITFFPYSRINQREFQDTANEDLRFHPKGMDKGYVAGLLGNSYFVLLTYVACVLALVRDSHITLVKRLNTHRL